MVPYHAVERVVEGVEAVVVAQHEVTEPQQQMHHEAHHAGRGAGVVCRRHPALHLTHQLRYRVLGRAALE